MTVKSAITAAALLAATGLAGSGMISGCDYGTPAAAAAAVSGVLRCGSVVDPAGYERGPLTASLAVALLTAMRQADGAADIARGRPTSADTSTLDTMAVELMGHSGSRLAADAQAFAVAELNYNPGGPVDPAYARPLDAGIAGLQRDCPDGMRLGLRWSRLVLGGRRRDDLV